MAKPNPFGKNPGSPVQLPSARGYHPVEKMASGQHPTAKAGGKPIKTISRAAPSMTQVHAGKKKMVGMFGGGAGGKEGK